MLSCSWFRPRLVTEENCQLRTSESWDHFAAGGVRKNLRFWKTENFVSCRSKVENRSFDSGARRRRSPHSGLCGEHVVPEDGGPATGQLTHVRNYHNWQRQGLKQTKQLIPTPPNFISRSSSGSHLQFNIESRLVELQVWLKAERVKLLSDNKRRLKKNMTNSSSLETNERFKTAKQTDQTDNFNFRVS